MLSIFPDILFLAPLAPFVIRIALAVLFVSVGWSRVYQNDLVLRSFALVEIAVAAALALGAWTQPAALAGALVVLAWIVRPTLRPTPVSTALLALVMCLSLLVTGAGAFAFDLPL